MSDTDEKIISFVKDNQDTLKISVYLAGLGSCSSSSSWASSGRGCTAPRAGRVASRARRPWPASRPSRSPPPASASAPTANLHPAESAGTYRLATVVFGMLSFAALVFVEAASIVIIRTKFLPAWLGWLGMLSALLWLVGGAAVATEDDTIFVFGFVGVPRLGAVDR